MKRYMPAIFISLSIFVIGCFVLAYQHSQAQQHEIMLEAKKRADAQAAEANQKTADQETKKATLKKDLDKCIADVNDAITKALNVDPTTVKPEYTQNVLQVQQTQTAQCQARYSSNSTL
jgi:hypothetical protein